MANTPRGVKFKAVFFSHIMQICYRVESVRVRSGTGELIRGIALHCGGTNGNPSELLECCENTSRACNKIAVIVCSRPKFQE